jgi:hypothetical protein
LPHRRPGAAFSLFLIHGLLLQEISEWKAGPVERRTTGPVLTSRAVPTGGTDSLVTQRVNRGSGGAPCFDRRSDVNVASHAQRDLSISSDCARWKLLGFGRCCANVPVSSTTKRRIGEIRKIGAIENLVS